MTMEGFKNEIRRAYRVLGYQGAQQNERDIDEWFKSGLITEQEMKELKTFDRYECWKLYD